MTVRQFPALLAAAVIGGAAVGAVSRAQDSKAAPQFDLLGYEYKVETRKRRTLTKDSVEESTERGWELVSVVVVDRDDTGHNTFQLFFKRKRV